MNNLGNTVVMIYLGIIIVMVIAAITLGRRRPNSHINDTTNASDPVNLDSDDIPHDHHNRHADKSTGSDSSP